jgi:(1->4)-alpha-D-glucan 1-alpha-D-glucosylmutase
VARFQQVTAATTAKGVEDTAFYRYARLLCENEVGGDPADFGMSLDRFHAFCAHLAERWPLTMVGTTTHDTKRSEDARLRIAALSEFAPEWADTVQSLSNSAKRFKQGEFPDPLTEYVLWQTLVAAHPISAERLCRYLEKAMREAKLNTSWLAQNPSYEKAVLDFARSVLDDRETMDKVSAFVNRIAKVAWHSSLSQTLLKLSACGVPDIYQGSEIWDTRLTDPDNRGPVDFELRKDCLRRVAHASIEEALAGFEEGLPKLWLTQRVLGLRRLKPDWFGPSARYVPLPARGSRASSIVSFSRGEHVVVIAPRWWRPLLEQGFGDTSIELPNGAYRNLFDSDARYSGRVELQQALRRFPVALLIAENKQ